MENSNVMMVEQAFKRMQKPMQKMHIQHCHLFPHALIAKYLCHIWVVFSEIQYAFVKWACLNKVHGHKYKVKVAFVGSMHAF